MANEENNAANITQNTDGEEAHLNNSENGSQDVRNVHNRNLHTEDLAMTEYKNPEENTTIKSRTVSFSEDTVRVEEVATNERNSRTRSKELNATAIEDVEYDDSGVPYDRGWAWVIDFSCFFLFFIYINHDNYISVLLMDYVQQFDIPISVVTVLMSLGSVCYCVATQISTNVLVVRFSIRVVTSCAAILNVGATLLLAIVPNVATFFISNLVKYTVKGFTLLATLTLVGYYFRRRRGLAITIGFIGVGVSSMCAPPLIRYLREEYGFQGCFLILAGIEMHAIVAAFLLRPIHSYKTKRAHPKSSRSDEETYPLIEGTALDQSNQAKRASVVDLIERSSAVAATISEIPIAEEDEQDCKPKGGEYTPLFLDNQKALTGKADHVNDTQRKGFDSKYVDFRDNSKMKAYSNTDINKGNETKDIKLGIGSNPEGTNELKQELIISDNNIDKVFLENKKTAGISSHVNTDQDENQHVRNIDQTKLNPTELSFSATNGKVNLASHEDVFQISNFAKPGNSSKDVTEIENPPPKAFRTSNWSLVTTSTMGSVLNIAHVIDSRPASEIAKPKTRSWVRDLIDVSLLKNYLAIMICLNYILVNAGWFGTVYLPSHAKRVGVSLQNAAVLLSILGAMDITGRLLFGYFADLKLVRPHLLIAATSAALGLTTHFIELFTDFERLMVFAVIQGLFSGVGSNLTTVLVVDVVGIQHIAKLLSMSSLLNSVAMSIQHAVQGAVIEATGSFSASYHYIGVCLFLSTSLLLSEPLIRKLQMAKERRAQESRDAKLLL